MIRTVKRFQRFQRFYSQFEDLELDLSSIQIAPDTKKDITHTPVLLEDSLKIIQKEFPDVNQPIHVMDATFGGGGFSKAIVDLYPNATVLAVDRDVEAIRRAVDLDDKRIIPCLSCFSDLQRVFKEFNYRNGKFPMFDIAMFDVGVSSFQIDDGARGFSIKREGPLDMRMTKIEQLEELFTAEELESLMYYINPSANVTAAHVVNQMSAVEISDILRRYGDVSNSLKIGNMIALKRKARPFDSTLDLAHIIEGAGYCRSDTNPVVKSFQAIRVYINNELEELKLGLEAAEKMLNPDGLLMCKA
jgi:16S rRNA (cytosine1402-N4)-methyltransferase